MYFANPWGLVALASLPIIAFIHLYHRRFPPLLVAGTHLWGAEHEVRTAGRRRDRLPITASLILELLAALLLSLALADPRIGDATTTRHLIVVLDNSASMSAKTPEGPSFRDLAIAELQQRAEEYERGSVFTIILTGHRPEMLAGPAVSWDDAKAALADWQPRATSHEFQSAWDLGAQLAENSGELLFLTDHPPPKNVPVPKAMESVSVGRRLENVALNAARWTFDSATNQGHLFLRLTNHGRKSATATVEGKAGENVVFRQTVNLEANAGLPLETDLQGGLGELTVTLTAPEDGLTIDNTAQLIEQKVRTVTVSVDVRDDLTRRKLTDVLGVMRDVQYGGGEQAHLVFAPATELPPSRADLWWMGMGPLDSSEEARKMALDLTGPYLIEKRNPLLDGIVLGGVVWGGVQPLELSVTPLISAGIYPLLAQLNGTQTTAYLLNIDLSRSNLTESPDWPILLTNLIELRRDALPGSRRWNYRLNEEITFRLFEGVAESDADAAKPLVLVHNDKPRPLIRTPVVEVPPLEDTGVYDIRNGEQSFGRFAVNFVDPDESTLTNLAPGRQAPAELNETDGFLLDQPYSWLIMLAVLCIALAVFVDWWVLKTRRV